MPFVSECVYAALTTTNLVGMGGDLEALVDRVCEEWDRGGEDVAVWAQRETGPARLAAIVRCGPAGQPCVTWFSRPSKPPELSVFRGEDE